MLAHLLLRSQAERKALRIFLIGILTTLLRI
jgi:hypothetical protein